ncbi:hypothetical protein AGMMS49579_22920 [Spirochaetia bacterium]|nr:hypothetical protein AGMMS49579_22920 [Spirochaetia bacterium]
MRRWYQDYAICLCQCLIREIELCINIFPIKTKLAIEFVNKINLEILLLKGWRKSTNKMFGKFAPKNDMEIPKQITMTKQLEKVITENRLL